MFATLFKIVSSKLILEHEMQSEMCFFLCKRMQTSMGNLMMCIWFISELKWHKNCRGYCDVKGYHGRRINILLWHFLPGQSPPESPWGRLIWRLLLARASCYPARLPAIQPWKCLSRGHSMASSSTSNETAIILKEWAEWVISSIKLSYLLAIFGINWNTLCNVQRYVPLPYWGPFRHQ